MERVSPKRRVEVIDEKKVNIAHVMVVLKRWEKVRGHLGPIYIGG